jgi:hypothetical protein
MAYPTPNPLQTTYLRQILFFAVLLHGELGEANDPLLRKAYGALYEKSNEADFQANLTDILSHLGFLGTDGKDTTFIDGIQWGKLTPFFSQLGTIFKAPIFTAYEPVPCCLMLEAILMSQSILLQP